MEDRWDLNKFRHILLFADNSEKCFHGRPGILHQIDFEVIPGDIFGKKNGQLFVPDIDEVRIPVQPFQPLQKQDTVKIGDNEVIRYHQYIRPLSFRKSRHTVEDDIAFRSTFIVGFPGETEEQFNELIDFIKEMRFERAGVFAYSAEEGTPAYELEDDVPEDVKKARVDKFMDVQQDISLEINQKRLGKTEKVLIDRTEGGYYVGRTQYDSPEVDDEVLISMKDNDLQIGSFVNVKIISLNGNTFKGEVI